MPRLTRQESQQITRQKLIDTAAFAPPFKDKDELLLEVVELYTKREFQAINNLVITAAKLEKNKVLARISKWLRALKNNKIFSGLLLEFRVYVNHNAHFRTHYDDNKRRWHVEMANALEAVDMVIPIFLETMLESSKHSP